MKKTLVSRRQVVKGASLLALGGLIGCSTHQQVSVPDHQSQSMLGLHPILTYTDLLPERPASLAAWTFQDKKRDTIVAGRLTEENAADTLRAAERRIHSVWSSDGYVEPVSSLHPGINNAPVWIITPHQQLRSGIFPNASGYSESWFDALRETVEQLRPANHRLPTHSLHLVLHRESLTKKYRLGRLGLIPSLADEAVVAAEKSGWPANMVTVQHRLRTANSLDHFVLKPVFRGFETWSLYPSGLESQIL